MIKERNMFALNKPPKMPKTAYIKTIGIHRTITSKKFLKIKQIESLNALKGFENKPK